MKVLSEFEIDQYLHSKEWIDKAGAYSIQEKQCRFSFSCLDVIQMLLDCQYQN